MEGKRGIGTMRLSALGRTAAGLVAAVAVAASAAAAVVGGGGRRSTDCLAVFELATEIPHRRLVCVDGDPSCDADGTVNGRCTLPVSVCANSTFDAACSLAGVASIEIEHSADNGDPRFDPDFQALQARIDGQIDPPFDGADACTTPTGITVPVDGPFVGARCRRGRKVIRMRARSSPVAGRVFEDRDRLRLSCVPAPGGCDPRVLFSSTFDRIQRQVFDQNCAVSSCHDSQTMQANLLLEVGASYGELVGVDPTNGVALAMGWKRVDQIVAPDANGENGVGDPATSLLIHKVEGTLGAGLGARMPFGRPPLNRHLIDLLRLWVEAGAPAVGWVPGTDR